MNNSIIDVGRGVDIVGQVMSKFSISLLIMTIGMIVGAMFVPPAVAIMMPIVCVVMLLVACLRAGASVRAKAATFR